jgi:ComF family protein
MLAEPLASILYDYLTNSADFPWRRAQCIVPVPIHPERLRVRGYNQSELLAGELSKLVELPLVADAVFRSVRTRPQVELSGDERRSNVKSAFQVTKPEAITGKIVLLVDDVATTCSTVHECSLTIKNVGASKVYVLCLAFGA